MSEPAPRFQDVDVLVVGAGLSGICAAHALQTRLPHLSYTIVEQRDALGGTWDLFRYPGVRSDSDMHTLGFSFRPWTGRDTVAEGADILAYLKDTATELGINEKIRFGTRVQSASWSSEQARWTVRAADAAGAVTYRARFLWGCAGYYDYAEGYTPAFEGREVFRGQVIHPQAWPDGDTCDGKRVVVIGSGATAVTLVPTLSRTAAHVTMLQRSPSYVFPWRRVDPVARLMRGRVPDRFAHALMRWKYILHSMALFQFSRRAPATAKRHMVAEVRKALGPDYDVETHFTPSYDPWDQRVCLTPDGEMFEAIRSGRASVVTDHIDRFTEDGIALASGAHLDADVIVTATGLKLHFLGGVGLEVDGVERAPSERTTYKGMMADGVPNAAVSVGYTNASWTLKAELTAAYMCRLIAHCEARDYAWFSPRLPADPLNEIPLIDFDSGYVKRALSALPRQGHRAPWRLYQNYVLDLLMLRFGDLEEDMAFGRAPMPPPL